MPRQFIPSVEKGARLQLEKGLLTGHPVVDVRVTLTDGKAHSVDSSDVAFQTAAALALKEAANESTMALLEPIDRVDITVADDYLGAVMSDLRGRRGQVLGTEPADGMGPDGGWTVVHAEVPAGGAVALPHRPAVGVARHRVVRARAAAPRPAARRQGQGPAEDLIERAASSGRTALRSVGASDGLLFDRSEADEHLADVLAAEDAEEGVDRVVDAVDERLARGQRAVGDPAGRPRSAYSPARSQWSPTRKPWMVPRVWMRRARLRGPGAGSVSL